MGMTERTPLSPEKKVRARPLPGKAIFALCVASFFAGLIFSGRLPVGLPAAGTRSKFLLPSGDCEHTKRRLGEEINTSQKDIMGEVSRTHQAIQSLDKTISSLEMELAAARANRIAQGGPPVEASAAEGLEKQLPKAFAVIGINTAFSSKTRRDSLRQSWMPKGSDLKRLEEEKGIVLRFVIGHTATANGALDREIDAEEAEHKDFLRLDHVEGYHELSTKTRIYFAAAVSMWNADFYVKVDDDVHVNLGTLTTALARHKNKSGVYIGCMKSGPVLSHKGVKYHEPEYWKFGEQGNKYFRHATGQIYAISKDLASYISINAPILHRYANEDVSLGAWMLGLEVEHVDDRSFCCGTPPDCELKTRAGNACVASFDWTCSGICKSVDRMKYIHNICGEGEGAIWNVSVSIM